MNKKLNIAAVICLILSIGLVIIGLKYTSIKEDLKCTTSELESTSEKLNALKVQNKELEENIEDKNKKLDKYDYLITLNHEDLEKLYTEINLKNQEIDELNKSIKEQKDKINKLNKEITNNENKKLK